VIKRAAHVFDRVIVGVVGQSVRKSGSLFTPEERKGFLERALGEAGVKNVEVRIFTNLLVEFVRECGGNAIVKGLRAISDFEYEFEMNQLNRKAAPDIESVYIFASSEYSFIRSSGVKELATFGGDISGLVPDEVATALLERVKR
jgi:pantetheine-phosphate adenylyltransferase